MTKPTTPDEYLAALQGPARELLTALRRLVQETLPDADEALKWALTGPPTPVAWLHPDGMILVVASAHKDHANLVVTPSTLGAFEDQLAGFTTGKGRVSLPYGEEIPGELLRRIIEHRRREYEQDGVTWR